MKRTETISNISTTWEYVYNVAGWLEEVRKDGATQSTYSYDANGNRETYSGPLGTINDADTEYDDQDGLLPPRTRSK